MEFLLDFRNDLKKINLVDILNEEINKYVKANYLTWVQSIYFQVKNLTHQLNVNHFQALPPWV